jgi:hypothetical protein
MSEQFLTSKYNRNEFVSFLTQKFLPTDFEQSQNKIVLDKTDGRIKNAVKLGSCPSLELNIYEFKHDSGYDPRVTLSRESFNIIKNDIEPNALAVFFNEDAAQWRLSLITSDYGLARKKGRVNREFSNPRRFSYLLGGNCKLHTPESMLYKDYRVKSHEDLVSRFAIEVVTKQFYKDLFNWYDAWAVQLVNFPTGTGSHAVRAKKIDVEKNRQHLIRLITRLIFVWFLRQKEGLVPQWIFDEKEITKVLHNFDSKSEKQGNYYNGVIQNLFFATLNKPIGEREFANQDDADRKDDYGIKTKFRDFNDKSLYSNDYAPTTNPRKFIDLFNAIPFLNGGLFECLDNFDTKEYEDGFSREEKRAAFVPNCLFWGNSGHEGLIPLLNRYNFTIEENTPQDIDIALDPELLGKVFENLLGTYNEETRSTARNESGSFYTPREIVDYMVDTSLKEYFKGKLGSEKSNINEKLDKLFLYHESGHDFDPDQVTLLMAAINDCKILDPACGSGAFPMGILNKLAFIMQKLDPKNEIWRAIQINKVTEDKEKGNKRLNEINEVFDMSTGEFSNYVRKLFLIENCIHGVDIQPIAIQISKLRFFISLIADQKTGGTIENNFNVLPLPNLETKFVAANTLIGIKQDKSFLADSAIGEKQKELLSVRHSHFSVRDAYDKIRLRKKDELLSRELSDILRKDGFYTSSEAEQLTKWNPYTQTIPSEVFDAYWMFGINDGFDVVISNPPYVSTKGVSLEDKGILLKYYGFSDDTYTHFFFRGFQLLNEKGIINYISPKTFWTTQTKRNLRELLLSRRILYVFDTANPFKAVMVDTCIIALQNYSKNDDEFIFLDGSKDLTNPKYYTVPQSIYQNTQNSVIYKPTPENMKIQELYGQKVKELYNKWWDKISTSKNIEKNKKELDEYRKSLKPGDIALLGCLTEGGQGLATANNGKYIAVRKSSKWAKNIIESRPKKLDEAIKTHKIKVPKLSNFVNTAEYLKSLSENDIAALFDTFKEKYGRDIFGQGYLYKLVDDEEIVNVDKLTKDEKTNGISNKKKYYVPYDKGDKDGNRWYLETPFAIAWSKENVQYLKTDLKARYQGYMYFFKEGFCWTNILNPQARLLKTKIKFKSVNDVGSMSLFSIHNSIPNYYLVVLLNSELIFNYYREFINCTVNIQINDIRQLPIYIPSLIELNYCYDLFKKVLQLKKDENTENNRNKNTKNDIDKIETELNEYVMKLYQFV